MDYTTLDIAELLRLATVEKAHAERIQPSIDRWAAYCLELDNSANSLKNEASSAGSQWPDAAGELFLQRANENVATILRKKEAVSSSDVVGRLSQLQYGIHTAYDEVLNVYNEYRNQEYPDAAALEAAAKRAAQLAGASLKRLAALFVSAGSAVHHASGPGISWSGTKTAPDGPAGGAAPAGGPPPAGAPPAGAPPAAGPAGGPAAESAAPGGAAPAGAPGGGAAAAPAPAGSLSPTGAGPSLAGLTTPAPIGTLPPVSMPNLPAPALMPAGLIPSISGIRPNLGGLNAAGLRPTGGLTPGGLGSTGVTSIPKAGPTVAASATQAAGQTPARAEAIGTQSANRPPGTTGSTPMMPPMAGGMGGAGAASGAPRAGTADPATRRGRPPRTVPGVPAKLRGRAGKLDGKSAFLTSAGRSTSGRRDEDPESTTVQLLDEDLWHVENPHRPLPH